MSKPTPGQQYTVVKGDTLWDIAASAYGDPRRYSEIWKVNQSTLQSNDPHWIYPGEVLWIPVDPDLEHAKNETFGDILTDKTKNDFTIMIEGVEVPAQSASVEKSIDTCSNGWSAKVYWSAENTVLKPLLRPYGYQKAKVYVGGLQQVEGILYKIKKSISPNGSFAMLEGNNPTADIIDSTFKPPYQRNNVSLLQLAEDLVKPFGIPIVVENADSVNDSFKRVTATRTDKIFDFLLKLAKQRSVLISSTDAGELLFTTAQKSVPVGMIEEGKFPWMGGDLEADGRARFHVYKAVGQGPKARKKFAVANDVDVPRPRFTTVEADETTQGDIQKSADWARSKQLADALTIDVPVSSWYAPNNTLWREGSMVTLKAPSLDLDEGTDLLIRSVKFNFAVSGLTANLSVVPLQVYTGEPLEIEWV